MKKQGQVIISYILSKTMFFGLGASYIIGNAKQNSWLAIILGYLFGLIVLHFLMKKRLDLINKNILGKIAYYVLIFFNAKVAWGAWRVLGNIFIKIRI